MKIHLKQGDSKDILKNKIPDNFFDLIITDPPYGLNFMNNSWDSEFPQADFWYECWRCLKPGAFLFTFTSNRQDLFHDALKVLFQDLPEKHQVKFNNQFPTLYWTYATGAPKGTCLDKTDPNNPYTPSYLKPATEPIIWLQKPYQNKTKSKSTKTKQFQTSGKKGAIWLNPTTKIPRRTTEQNKEPHFSLPFNLFTSGDPFFKKRTKSGKMSSKTHKRDPLLTGNPNGYQSPSAFGAFKNISKKPLKDTPASEGSFSRFFDLDIWIKNLYPNNPEIQEFLNQQPLPHIIQPKPSSQEKNHLKEQGIKAKDLGARRNKRASGVLYQNQQDPFTNIKETTNSNSNNQQGQPSSLFLNDHPTPKPRAVYFYLLHLALPLYKDQDIEQKSFQVLDPFAGSGTLAMALSEPILRSKITPWMFEKNPHYIELIKQRIKLVFESLK